MHWIALRWPPEIAAAREALLPSPEALGWWALQFTPRVAWVDDEALLLEVSACERLWGGRLALMREIARLNPVPDVPVQRAQGATSLVALARLRMFARGERMAALLAASQLRRKLRQQQQGGPAPRTEGATVIRLDLFPEQGHALDRTALAA